MDFLFYRKIVYDEPKLRKALKRYVQICQNKKYAQFLIAKTIPVEFSSDTEEEILWKKHSKAMIKFRKRLKEIDRKNEKLKFAELSLLDLKLNLAKKMLEKCEFCERKCRIDRRKERGFCGVGSESFLSSEFIHMGEEVCIIPSHTFFFIGCNFYCVYCQNWTISRHKELGFFVNGKQLAELARKRNETSRNINLVGGEPTPHLHTIIEMLKYLDINKPIIWNSNMYMSEKTMQLLEGLVDVYLADFKYGNNECAKNLSKVENYWEIVSRNHLLGFKSAELLIRHLVLPGHVECCTKEIMEWLGRNFGNKVRVNIMDQYHPEFEAFFYKDMDRRVTTKEMEMAFKLAKENGVTNIEP
jgi:putative pyruvate formate lyase activating enzyme